MSDTNPVTAALAVTRSLPTIQRYALAVALVFLVLLLRQTADPIMPNGYPFLFFFIAILLAAALFDHGCGLIATVLSAALAMYFYLPPLHSFQVADPREYAALSLFVLVGLVITYVIEALHTAVASLQSANGRLALSERNRRLLLHEFRHRTRNDLGSLVALLHLRARAAPSEAARDGLREAAQHAMALAQVHTWLVAADGETGAEVDTREFILGLCHDMNRTQGAAVLRPVALLAEAEAHKLETERAVQLGLVLNEAVTNSLKYAFPDGRAGTVRVRFHRHENDFVLTVTDDGIGPPPEVEMDGTLAAKPERGSGLGTRLLLALAAQLRGSFTRGLGPAGSGTLNTLHFPVAAPSPTQK